MQVLQLEFTDLELLTEDYSDFVKAVKTAYFFVGTGEKRLC